MGIVERERMDGNLVVSKYQKKGTNLHIPPLPSL